MPSFARAKPLDAVAWRWATISAPFVVQAVLALLLIMMRLLGNRIFATESGHGERAWMLTATIITAVMSLALGGVLLRSSSSRNRGLGLSIAASSILVLIGAAIFAYLMLR